MCWMKGFPPKSEKLPVLVLNRLIRRQLDLNVVGLLYHKQIFFSIFASLA